METKIIHPNEINIAIEGIKAGELVAFPTETVYGLGADATNEAAVKSVYIAKGRPSDNPLIVHVSNEEEIRQFVGELPERACKLIASFWPGPLTLIFKLKEDSGLSQVVTGGLSTAAFRMPNNELTLKLIKESGKVLVGPSANTSGLPSPTIAQHVFDDLSGKIYGVLDGGACQVGLESTVLDLSDANNVPVILRPGAITQSQLEAVVGPVIIDNHLMNDSEKPKAPGMKYKHYSPNTPVIMIGQDTQWQEAIDSYKQNNQKVALLVNNEKVKELVNFDVKYKLSETKDVKEAMSHLFAGLRALDLENCDVIFSETYPEKDEGLAYMNRLKKASGGKIYSK